MGQGVSPSILCGTLHGWCCLSLIHISEPTRRTPISYAVFCLKKKNSVCSTNLGFSGEKNCACVRLILVLVWYQVRYVPDTMYLVSAGRVWYQVRTCNIGLHPPQNNAPPVDAHVWRQLLLSAVARFSDSYCIFRAKRVSNCYIPPQNLCVFN